MYILANSMSSSGKCLFRSSAHFLIGFVFLMLVCITSLYILGLKVKVAQSCLFFETPWTMKPVEFSRQEHWNGQPFPSPGNLPNPGIKPRSPKVQADSLSAEPPGKPIF